MKYNPLGKSGIEVSEISFGCMSLGSDLAENKSLLHQALDSGINFFDTADLYGRGENEEFVGQAFAGVRNKVIIATKVGNQLRADGSGWDWNPSKKYILEAVDKSLARLQSDYIDLYQLHGGTIDDPLDEAIEAFELLKQQGKIRAYGISSIRPNVIHEYVKRSHIDTVMMQYSLLDRRPEESCLNLLHKNKLSVLVRGSLAQGLLINKPATSYLNHTREEIENSVSAIHTLKSRTPQEIAIRYTLAADAVSSVVIGIHSANQLNEARVAISGTALQKEELAYLQSVTKANRYEQHRYSSTYQTNK